MQYDSAMEAVVELAASRHNAIHTTEAAKHIPTQRLRRGQLQGHLYRLHPNVWAFTALPRSELQLSRAAALSISGAAITTTSAAWLHGWLEQPPDRPQLWVPSGNSRNHSVADLRRWARIEPAHDITLAGHIPTLNKAATLCSLGPHVDDATLERCLDEFLRTDSIRWLDNTMVRLGSRKPGGVRALERIRNSPNRVEGIAESWLERMVAKLIAVPGMPPLNLQHRVVVSGQQYRLDIACPELRLGIEAHSRTFHFGRQKEEADNVRDLALTSAGWQVLYVTHAQASAPAAFVDLFAKTARTRAAQLGIELSNAS